MLESILYEQDNIFNQANKINSVKLYTGQVNPALIAKGFDSESTDPEAVLDLMNDGAFIGKVLEKTVLGRLKGMGYNIEALGKNAPYDLKYTLKNASDEVEEGQIEVRVIGKTGVDLSPSSTRGANRKKDAIKTLDKIEGSKYYILVDIRNLKVENGPSNYDVYLVLSSYLSSLFKGNKLGKYGNTKSATAIDSLLKGNLTPNTVEEYEELIANLKSELETPQTPYPKRTVLRLLKQYTKELEKLNLVHSSLKREKPSEVEDLGNLRLVAEYRYRHGLTVLTMAE